MDTDIEVSFDIKASVCGRFWINRDEWAAMSPASRNAKIEEIIDAANTTFDRGDIDVGPGLIHVNAVAIEGEPGVYDPQAEG